jgi:hypothetical protein
MEEQTIYIYFLISVLVFVSTMQRTRDQDLFTEKDTFLLPIITALGSIVLYIMCLTVSKNILNIFFKILFIIFGYWSIIANLIYLFEVFEYQYEEKFYGEINESDFEEILIENEHQERLKVKAKKKRTYKERLKRYCMSIYTTLNLFHFTIYCIAMAIVAIYSYNSNKFLTLIISMSVCFGTIRVIKLDRMITGYINLALLFIYDIIRLVFGSKMEKTMEGIEAPIFLAFPHHYHGFEMVGLGDIFIPGLYICIVKKFCDSKMGGKMFLYWWTFLSYNIGLGATLFLAWVTGNPKPALLIISPLMIIVSGLAAMFKGCFREFVFFKRSRRV